MPITQFPPVNTADERGLLAVGGDLAPESLILAYSQGIFPWPISERGPIPWFSPPQRAVLFLAKFRPPRSLKKAFKQHDFSFRIDSAFTEVIENCAKVPRVGQSRTWITPQMRNAYGELFRLGYAHSVECFQGEQLVGGLYGVSLGAMFAGESMFHLLPNASKLCLYFLVEHLKQRGASWIDCQQMTPLLQQFGAELLPRREFIRLLERAVKQEVSLF